MISNIDWKKVDGLIPVIVQDASSKTVLMLAYMDKEAFSLTCKNGFAYYYSRTKKRIWKKGETSGNIQKVEAIYLDCDQDTLLLHVEQIGKVACHTGHISCFFNRIDKEEKTKEVVVDTVATYGIIDSLYSTIKERKNLNPKNSYVAKLLKGEENSLLKKIVEEAAELCFAMKDSDSKEIIYEAADLLFHVLVGLGRYDIHPDLIKQELTRRLGTSGIAEKNAREHGIV